MIVIKSFTQADARPFKNDLARLRIQVFREFPYLYDGSLEYEENYLETLFQSNDSIMVIAFDGEQVIGASTGMPLENETPDIQQPWIDHQQEISKVFYFSESVLLKKYRGQGIGVQFFQEREAWARKLLSFTKLTFCGVVRADDHPQRPKDYFPLDEFWKKRGFSKQDGYICYLSWKEVGESQESKKALQFWSKDL
ncbi:MAG: GNAT family acetyltransferase [Saprospiraceae bacterium]|nr:MAG: GNAT family acetyltransferase [Saprospiraceae bacterium]